MGNFVYQFYTSNLDILQEQYEKTLAEKAVVEEAAEHMEIVAEVSLTPPIMLLCIQPEQPAPSEQQTNVPQVQHKRKGAENAEGMILFESVDFERMEQLPNYGGS